MIKERIDGYLGFDSGLIFKRAADPMCRIFGGAVRDSIASMEIHDVDILAGPETSRRVAELLKEQGYMHMDQLHGKDLGKVYADIGIISEPWTFVRGGRIVQLIRPSIHRDAIRNKGEFFRKNFVRLIQNVDLSCCGVSWDGNSLYENVPNAVAHCMARRFETDKGSAMYSKKRTLARAHKLMDRGWTEIQKGDQLMKRDMILGELLGNKIDYVPESAAYGGSWAGDSREAYPDDLFDLFD